MTASFPGGSRRWPSLVAALFILNASVTFRNVWPTPAFWWAGDLSVELAIGLLILLAAGARQRAIPRPLVMGLTAAWVILVFGRYADVTTPALLGRPINLVWDVRYARDVTAMFVRAAPLWGVALAALALIAIVGAVYLMLRWALVRIADAAMHGRQRLALAGVALALLGLYVVSARRADAGAVPHFGTPVAVAYVQQARLLRNVLTADANALPPTPPMTSDLSRVAGADVMLMFMESYGAVTWQRPDFVTQLAAPRAQLADDIRDSGRRVVSAFVESPTYGGSSWFAHISLLSGIEIRDPNANAVLMTQHRDTMVGAFARRGFRTVALMPGLWQPWPEGSFYGFQEIYGGDRLGYQGPEFGWWALPDQFTLARFDALEIAPRPRKPVFVFFPTVSTHTPFTPTPPYQPDWSRVVTGHPFDDAVVEAAFDQQPDWMDLSPSYANAVAYAYRVLGGYLRERQGHDFVVVVLGDHQPPALVSGEGQPWDVPVHVITSRLAVLDRLVAHGFHDGLDPTGARVSKMHELLPALLDAFGDPRPE